MRFAFYEHVASIIMARVTFEKEDKTWFVELMGR